MSYHILIVDDDESVVHSLTRTLHCADYDIATVASAEEGLVHARNHEVDLIISDYKLGGMDGIHFLETAQKKYPRIVSILLTGSTNAQIAVDAINRFPLYKFFVKPWNNSELQAAVKEAFQRHSFRRLPDLTAADIMSKFPVTIREDVLLSSAAELMMRFKISGMPVMSLSGKLTGIITATDLFRIMGKQEEKDVSGGVSDVGNLRISEVMSKNVETIKKETSLKEMIRLMHGKNIHTMPVVEDGELVGIVGRRDVLNTYYRNAQASQNR